MRDRMVLIFFYYILFSEVSLSFFSVVCVRRRGFKHEV